MFTGKHTINLKIYDMQGNFGISNISVTVCNCSINPNCQSRRETSKKAASGAIVIVFATVLLLMCKTVFAIKICILTMLRALHIGFSTVRLADSSAAGFSLHLLQERVRHFTYCRFLWRNPPCIKH